MSEAMFNGNCLTEREDLYTKTVLRFFYCNLIYKLKLIKQNVTFFSYFHIKIDIHGQ